MSLARALLSGVSESSLDLTGYDFEATASMESYYLDAACESLLQDIFNVDKAFMVADVVGEVQVIKEGADPAVLLEGMIGDAFNKLKEGFKKFLAKIKAWFAKVKKFFQVLFMNGKELAKKYGDEINKKSTKGFKYKGFKYTIKAGDDLVDKISDGVTKEIEKLTGLQQINLSGFVDADSDKQETYMKSMTYKKEAANGDIVEKALKTGVSGVTKDTSTSDYQDKLVKLVCGASDMSDMSEKINDAYRNKDTEKIEIEDFEANDPSEMLDFLKTFDKAIKDANKKESDFEKDVKTVIKMLDKISSQTNKKEETGNTYTYKLASKVSSFISAALSVRKTACDKKVATYKEINSSWTSVLKSFLLKKEVKESAFFEDFDGMISLTEAADAEPEVPEKPEQDETGEGDSATKEGYKKSCESASLLESAYNYL